MYLILLTLPFTQLTKQSLSATFPFVGLSQNDLCLTPQRKFPSSGQEGWGGGGESFKECLKKRLKLYRMSSEEEWRGYGPFPLWVYENPLSSTVPYVL